MILLCFSVEDMQKSRYRHGCGTIHSQDGSGNKEIVVAGDYLTIGSGDAYSVEIYSTSEDKWRIGEEFNCY